MSAFFIDRPVFAWVLAIVVMLGGALGIVNLPIAQYPSVAPPSISITATYPGASADTVQSTVVQVIEQQLSGLDGLLYFSSVSTKDGTATITLSFAQGTDPDTAQVQVQNKVQLAQSRLPQAVQQQGIRVAKATRNFLMVIGFVSTDRSMTGIDLADFIASNVQDPLSRTTGVGDYQLFGSQYAMRIWLDPARLEGFALTASDVAAAVRAQNVQIASGELGALPAVPGQRLSATLIGPSYLRTVEQFGAILLRVQPDGSQVRLSDVARVEMGGEAYGVASNYNGLPAAAIAVNLASGANALAADTAVRAMIDGLRSSFPPGVEAVFPYDTSPFVRISIEEVVITLAEAIGLVFLVMLIFLQNFRATLIPTLAVPVVLLGTFGVIYALGFSINTLTMFGVVLAIGLLVDDAIVVVENVERLMAEEDLSPLEATRKSMQQISGALVGIGMVLTAVFLPMAFLGGSTGVIYRQFSVTIATAMALSVVVALVFTPALCATMLRKRDPEAGKKGPAGWFNRTFERFNKTYGGTLGWMLGRPLRWMLVYGVLAGAMAFLFIRMPSAFLPDEDQGVMYLLVSTPPGATADRTQRALDEVSRFLREENPAEVASVFSITGFSFAGRGQNAGLAFVSLKPWDERAGAEHGVGALAGRVLQRFGGYTDAMIFPFPPPPITELGNASGFDIMLVDRLGLGHDALMAARNQFLGLAAQSRLIAGVRPNGQEDEPQYRLDIDWERASALGVSITEINATISAAWGSTFVNDFIDRGRVKRVYMQGDAPSRMQPDDLGRWFVRNAGGQMVPFTAFASASWGLGSPRLERYNGRPSVELIGSPAAGQTTGGALEEVERIARELPAGIGVEFTGLSFEERQAGSQTLVLYGLAMLVVFLCLAALYESWAIPVAVILVVPLGILGAVVASTLRGMPNDVYFQVALLTTIGLSAKNAILIVEFAKEEVDRGAEVLASALHAAQQRLRPILMTSIAFMLGVLPLAISTGAGSGGQNAIGTGVIGGMLTGTVLALLFVPVFFLVVLMLFRRGRPEDRKPEDKPPEDGAEPPADRKPEPPAEPRKERRPEPATAGAA